MSKLRFLEILPSKIDGNFLPVFESGLYSAKKQKKTSKERARSAEKEKERLSQYHTYNDGLVDQPFLTPDTVKDE